MCDTNPSILEGFLSEDSETVPRVEQMKKEKKRTETKVGTVGFPTEQRISSGERAELIPWVLGVVTLSP